MTDNEDGTTTFVVVDRTPPEHFDVNTAALNLARPAGLPFFLEPPSVKTLDNVTYSSDFRALYITTTSENVDEVPVLYRGGQRVSGWKPDGGASYTLDADGVDEFLQVQIGVALFTPSGGTTPVTSLVEIQAAAEHTQTSARQVADTSYVSFDLSRDAMGDPVVPVRYPRFAVALWMRRVATNFQWIWDADTDGATEDVFTVRMTNSGVLNFESNLHQSATPPPDIPVEVGDRVCVVYTFEAGHVAQAFISINGADFVGGEAHAIKETSPGHMMAFSRAHFLSNLDGAGAFGSEIERIEIFNPTQTVTLSNVKPKLVTSEGRSPLHALAYQEFGQPLWSFDGDFTKLHTAQFGGSMATTDPVLVGSFESAET